MYEIRFIYKDGTCAVWSKIINIYIDTDGIYFMRLHENNHQHFISWKENLKDIKVVKNEKIN